MKNDMLFGLSHREKRVKMNLLYFPEKIPDFRIAGTVH